MFKRTSHRNLAHLARSEDGWVTAFSLFLVIVALIMGGLALDYTQGIERRAHMQAAADAAALAAVLDLPDEATATVAGLAIADQYFTQPNEQNTIIAGDFVYGHWDVATDAFIAGATPVDAVRVVASRQTGRGNEVGTFLLGFVGKNSFDINVFAIARGATDAPCDDDAHGLFSDAEMIMQGSDAFHNEFCVYGHDRVRMSSMNEFDLGVQVVMEDIANLDQGGSTQNVNIDEALRNGTFDLGLPDLVDGIVTSALAGSLLNVPSYITNISVVSEITHDTVLVEGTLYVVNGVADFGSNNNGASGENSPVRNIAVVATGEIKAQSNNIFDHVMFATQSKITFGTNNIIGDPDACSNGVFDTYLFSGSDLEVQSNSTIQGVQMAAKGFLKLQSNMVLIGTRGEARQLLTVQTDGEFSGCPGGGGLVSDFTGSGSGGGGGGGPLVKFSLIR